MAHTDLPYRFDVIVVLLHPQPAGLTTHEADVLALGSGLAKLLLRNSIAKGARMVKFATEWEGSYEVGK